MDQDFCRSSTRILQRHCCHFRMSTWPCKITWNMVQKSHCHVQATHVDRVFTRLPRTAQRYASRRRRAQVKLYHIPNSSEEIEGGPRSKADAQDAQNDSSFHSVFQSKGGHQASKNSKHASSRVIRREGGASQERQDTSLRPQGPYVTSATPNPAILSPTCAMQIHALRYLMQHTAAPNSGVRFSVLIRQFTNMATLTI